MEDFMRQLGRRHGLQVVVVDKDHYVDLQVLAVSEEYRGRGIGTSFMAQVCEEADRMGVVIGTRPEGPTPTLTARLRRWYRRFGFTNSPDEDQYPVTYVRIPRQDAG